MPGNAAERFEPINFARKFALFHEQWQPKVVAELNDYQFKVVRLEGDFVWHDHQNPTRRSSCSTAHCGSISVTAQ